MSADSVDRKNNNKVVAQVPKTGVSTYDWVNGAAAKIENAPRTADRRDRVESLVGTAALGQTPYDYSSGTKAENDAYNLANRYNQPPVTAPVSVDPFAAYGGISGLTKMLQGGGSAGGSAGKDSALDWAKWNAEQSAAKNTTDTQLRALQGLQGRLASGGYRGNADALLGLINDQNTQGQAAIQGNYTTGMGNINAGYDTAQGMINTGYGDLNKYLTANQSNPYANLQQQVSPVNNAMANYLSAYGVSNDPVNQQVQASQMANQQGADSYNQLQQLMSANQLANNQSNLDVSQMAQNYATTGLGAQRAGYQANADTARTSAMNQLMDQINQARYGVEQDAGTRKNALEEAIIAAGGSLDGSMAGGGVDGKTVAPGSATARSQSVAAAADNYPNFKAALADLNPNYKFTTMAAAKKKFPALAGKF